jgi:hypothetical protein
MMFEQRKKERYEFSGDKVDFTLTPFAQDELYRAGVLNFSESGVCLLSPLRLSPGQEITLRDFMACSARSAAVIWVEKYADLFHLTKSDEVLFKTGLLFT